MRSCKVCGNEKMKSIYIGIGILIVFFLIGCTNKNTAEYVTYKFEQAKLNAGIITILPHENSEFDYLLKRNCTELYQCTQIIHNVPCEWAFENVSCHKKTNYTCYSYYPENGSTYSTIYTFDELDLNKTLRDSCNQGIHMITNWE